MPHQAQVKITSTSERIKIILSSSQFTSNVQYCHPVSKKGIEWVFNIVATMPTQAYFCNFMNQFAYKLLKESFLKVRQCAWLPVVGYFSYHSLSPFSLTLPGRSSMLLCAVHSQLEGFSLISDLMLTDHQEILLNMWDMGKERGGLNLVNLIVKGISSLAKILVPFSSPNYCTC